MGRLTKLIIDDLYNITNMDPTGHGYLCKDTFSQHNVIAQLFGNFTPTMALFSKLGNLQFDSFAEPKLGTNGQIEQVDLSP